MEFYAEKCFLCIVLLLASTVSSARPLTPYQRNLPKLKTCKMCHVFAYLYCSINRKPRCYDEGCPPKPIECFTPVRNISCSQCHMEMKKLDESTTYVEHEMTMRQCLDEPAKFFKPCPLDGNVAPRGCAKIVTYMMQPVAKGLMREVSTVRRFCASEGAEPEEIRCEYMVATGGHSELCVCGHDNCNQADVLQRTRIGLMMTTLLSTMIYAY